MLVHTSPLQVAPVMDDFVLSNLAVDCNQVEKTIVAMRNEYSAGITHIKNYLTVLGSSAEAWHAVLSPSANKTVQFPVGQFEPLKVSASNISVSSEKMSLWLEDFNEKFSSFSQNYTKCSANKNKKVQIEGAFEKFFEMSSEALSITVGLLDHTSRQTQQWNAAWSVNEGQDVFVEAEKFEVVLNLSSNMIESAQLVQDNADLALAELDIITEGTPNGRSSNYRAVQLFYR
ncbi:MAG: hypothetical protein AABZ31_10390 [Bdellovibrionota bacterium]